MKKYIKSLSMLNSDIDENIKAIHQSLIKYDDVVNSYPTAKYLLLGFYHLCFDMNLSMRTAIQAKKNAENSEKFCIEVELNNKPVCFAFNHNMTFANTTDAGVDTVRAWLIAFTYYATISAGEGARQLLENYSSITDVEIATQTMIALAERFDNLVNDLKDNPSKSKNSAPWGFFDLATATPDYADSIIPYSQIIAGGVDYNIKDSSFKYFVTGRKANKVKKVFDESAFVVNPQRIYNDYEVERLENNKLVEGYLPTEDDKLLVERVYNSITKRGFAPAIFLYGEAGTGKSEKGKYISKLTGLPYTFVTCSATTNESDLRGKPQSLGTSGGMVQFFKQAVKTLWGKDIAVSKSAESSEIQYSLTELVLACKYGWIIEIQEPTLIVNAGTLGFLNCVLDSNRTLILPDGREIKVHPNTVFIFTTNLTYEGCNLLNNSLLSRMNIVMKINRPSLDEQVKRVISVTGFTGPKKEVGSVVRAVNEINALIDQDEITQGVSDLRCAIECVYDYMLNGSENWRQSARLTIEDKAILEPGYTEAVKTTLDGIFGEEDEDDF